MHRSGKLIACSDMTGAAFRLPDLSALPAAKLQSHDSIRGFGSEALDRLLPASGLRSGTVTELRAREVGCGATALALRACRAAQAEQRDRWCAFVDPSQTLFAPAVQRLGVDLERLLVVRPRRSEIESVAACIVDSRIAAVLVLDLRSSRAAQSTLPASDAGLMTRMSLAIEGTGTSVVVLTQAERLDDPLPMSVTLRLSLTRTNERALEVRVTERAGRMTPARVVPWSLISTESENERSVPGALRA